MMSEKNDLYEDKKKTHAAGNFTVNHNVAETLLLPEDAYLSDIIASLLKVSDLEHGPLHKEMHGENTLHIAFGYETRSTAKKNYDSTVSLLKERLKISKENTNNIIFNDGSEDIRIRMTLEKSSVFMYGRLTPGAMKNAENNYSRLYRSRERWEQEQKEREDQEEKEIKKRWDEEMKNENNKLFREWADEEMKKDMEEMYAAEEK